MYCVAALILTAVWRITAIVPVLGKLRIAILGTGAALVLVFLSRHPARRFKGSPALYLILGLFAVVIMGLPFSLAFGRSFHFLLWDYLPTLILVIALVASVRSERDLHWMAAVYFVGASIYSLFVFRTFRVDSTGRLSDLVYYDANDLALALVATFPFALYFLRDGAPKWVRRVTLPLLLVMLVVFVRTGSRGGFLGLVTISLATLFGYGAIRTRSRVITIVGGAALFTIFAGEGYWAKMRTILAPEKDYNMTSETGRINVWKNGLELIAQRPLLGFGARCYAMANGTISKLARDRAMRGGGAPWEAAHNSYVEITAELGLPGLALFVAMLLTGILSMLRLRRLIVRRFGPRAPLAALAQTLAISLMGWMVSGTFLSAEYTTLIYMLIGFTVAAIKVYRLNLAEAAITPLPVHVPSRMPNVEVAAAQLPYFPQQRRGQA